MSFTIITHGPDDDEPTTVTHRGSAGSAFTINVHGGQCFIADGMTFNDDEPVTGFAPLAREVDGDDD
jgi:hypothetical protein